jgi:hypothetical protein
MSSFIDVLYVTIINSINVSRRKKYFDEKKLPLIFLFFMYIYYICIPYVIYIFSGNKSLRYQSKLRACLICQNHERRPLCRTEQFPLKSELWIWWNLHSKAHTHSLPVDLHPNTTLLASGSSCIQVADLTFKSYNGYRAKYKC